MRPTRIPGADPEPLDPPPDWDPARDGPCSALFVRRERQGEVEFMTSAWEVDPGEATLMYAGARLQLGISGDRHPVVNLAVSELPPDFEPVVHARRFNDSDGRPMVRVEMLYPHGGGRRGVSVVQVDGTLADAISTGITNIEIYARKEGWAT